MMMAGILLAELALKEINSTIGQALSGIDFISQEAGNHNLILEACRHPEELLSITGLITVAFAVGFAKLATSNAIRKIVDTGLVRRKASDSQKVTQFEASLCSLFHVKLHQTKAMYAIANEIHQPLSNRRFLDSLAILSATLVGQDHCLGKLAVDSIPASWD